MANGIERRASRRFTMALPLTVRSSGPAGAVEQKGQTRDVSFRGLYFLTDGRFEPGSEIEFVLPLPKEITLAGDVYIRCFGQVISLGKVRTNSISLPGSKRPSVRKYKPRKLTSRVCPFCSTAPSGPEDRTVSGSAIVNRRDARRSIPFAIFPPEKGAPV